MEKRPYRDALSSEDAIKVIQEEVDKKWNSKLADEFISLVKSDFE